MRRYVTALAAVVTLATACGGDKRAGDLPGPLPVTSTTPTTVPSTPSVATPEAQIETAARAYYATLMDAGQTGDVRLLKTLIAKSCTCYEQVEFLEKEAAAGRRNTTTYQVESVKPHDVTAKGGAAVVTFSAPESVVVDAQGRKVRTVPALKHVGVDVFFRRVGTTWVIERLVRLGA